MGSWQSRPKVAFPKRTCVERRADEHAGKAGFIGSADVARCAQAAGKRADCTGIPRNEGVHGGKSGLDAAPLANAVEVHVDDHPRWRLPQITCGEGTQQPSVAVIDRQAPGAPAGHAVFGNFRDGFGADYGRHAGWQPDPCTPGIQPEHHGWEVRLNPLETRYLRRPAGQGIEVGDVDLVEGVQAQQIRNDVEGLPGTSALEFQDRIGSPVAAVCVHHPTLSKVEYWRHQVAEPVGRGAWNGMG